MECIAQEYKEKGKNAVIHRKKPQVLGLSE